VADHGRGLDADDARRLHDALARRFATMSEGVDLVVSPTTPEGPPPVGAFSDQPPEAACAGACRYGAFTALCNVTGQPAASMPVLRAGQLPLGVQIAGQVGDDRRVLSVCRAVERELGGPVPVAPLYR
jgi:amidase